VPLEREALERETLRLLPTEAPLAGPDAVAQVVDTLVGLGPIEHLLRRPGVSDVLVNRFDEIWIEREGRLERTDVAFPNEAAVVAAVERVIAPLGLRIDRASPAVDARLPDGSRLHALIPPATVDGPVVAVRRFTEVVASLDELVLGGSVRREGADLLRNAVRNRDNVVVTGGTGSGKTSLLNLLSKEIPASERIVTVEDAAELRLSGHVVRLEARPANSEGAGRIDLETLVRHALRLRPDRLIVGEVRGPEALDLITAMTTGHDGSMGTVHAAGGDEAMGRLETLALSGGRRVAGSTVRSLLHNAVDLIVVMRRSGPQRLVASISEFRDGTGTEIYAC
jgi:pilus assembly protein CpaF